MLLEAPTHNEQFPLHLFARSMRDPVYLRGISTAFKNMAWREVIINHTEFEYHLGHPHVDGEVNL